VAYRKLLVAGLAESIVQAHAALRPAAVGYAAHPLPDEVFNRRWFLKPGKMPLNPFGKLDMVKMNPGTSPDVLDRPAGPIDPDVSILSVQDAKRRPLAGQLLVALRRRCAAGPDVGRLFRRIRPADTLAIARRRIVRGDDVERDLR
jgi:hypothetical protein